MYGGLGAGSGIISLWFKLTSALVNAPVITFWEPFLKMVSNSYSSS